MNHADCYLHRCWRCRVCDVGAVGLRTSDTVAIRRRVSLAHGDDTTCSACCMASPLSLLGLMQFRWIFSVTTTFFQKSCCRAFVKARSTHDPDRTSELNWTGGSQFWKCSENLLQQCIVSFKAGNQITLLYSRRGRTYETKARVNNSTYLEICTLMRLSNYFIHVNTRR